jgi:hypothetical protein
VTTSPASATPSVNRRRIHLTNNGLREPDSRANSKHVLAAALDRRRAAEQLQEP